MLKTRDLFYQYSFAMHNKNLFKLVFFVNIENKISLNNG